MSELVTRVLVSPGELVLERGGARHVPLLVALIAVSAMAFGAATGARTGGAQLVFAALKMPAVLLVPLLIAVPAARAVASVYGWQVSFEQAVLAGTVGAARTAVVAAALAPAVWLIGDVSSYGGAKAIVAMALLFSGAVGLPVVARGLVPSEADWRPGLRATACALAVLVVFGAVAAQTGWLLRPFVVSPTETVEFLRGGGGHIGLGL